MKEPGVMRVSDTHNQEAKIAGSVSKAYLE